MENSNYPNAKNVRIIDGDNPSAINVRVVENLANGGGNTPPDLSNYVTLDSSQTIIGTKEFSGGTVIQGGLSIYRPAHVYGEPLEDISLVNKNYVDINSIETFIKKGHYTTAQSFKLKYNSLIEVVLDINLNIPANSYNDDLTLSCFINTSLHTKTIAINDTTKDLIGKISIVFNVDNILAGDCAILISPLQGVTIERTIIKATPMTNVIEMVSEL